MLQQHRCRVHAGSRDGGSLHREDVAEPVEEVPGDRRDVRRTGAGHHLRDRRGAHVRPRAPGGDRAAEPGDEGEIPLTAGVVYSKKSNCARHQVLISC